MEHTRSCANSTRSRIKSPLRCQILVKPVEVLIETVENHMPQVIVIDEIGTKLEALAARTIAQCGIQLIATAYGVTIENLVMNPALEMLVGGVQKPVAEDLIALKNTSGFDYLKQRLLEMSTMGFQ